MGNDTVPPSSILRIEKCIASAHRALWRAQADAESAGLLGLEEDLWLHCLELQRLQEALLRGDKKLRKARQGHAYLSESA
jgi:hypothetical protein